MKRLCVVLLIITVSVVAMGKAFGQSWPAVCGGQPPHYFKHIRSPQTQKEKNVELGRVQQSYSAYWDATPPRINRAEEMETELYGKKVKIIFWQYSQEGDKVLYYTPHGVEQITLEEFQCVKLDMINQLNAAVEYLNFGLSGLTSKILPLVAEQLKVSEDDLRTALLKPIPDDPDITLADYMDWPVLEAKDFLGPKDSFTLHIGNISWSGVLGVAWLNSGTVGYHTVGRIYDHIAGKPLVLLHELMHANSKLQNMPLAWYFNPELFAALPEAMDNSLFTNWFLNWFYLADLQEAVHVFFNFDSKRAWKEIWKFNIGGALEFDEQKMDHYTAMKELIQKELRHFITNVLFPEFYYDPLRWAGINHKSRDDNMAFKVIFSRYYEPTILGGREKTAKWLDKNSRLLEDITKDAWDLVGKPRKMNGDQMKAIAELRTYAAAMGFTNEDIERFGRVFGRRLAAEDNISPETVKRLFKIFLNAESVGTERGVVQ